MTWYKNESFMSLEFLRTMTADNRGARKGLEKIDERSEISNKSFGKKKYTCSGGLSKKTQDFSMTAGKFFKSQEPVDFFKNFFGVLLKNKEVYKSFIDSCISRQVIQKIIRKASRKSYKSKRAKRTLKITNDSQSEDSDYVQEKTVSKSFTTRKAIFVKPNVLPKKPIETPKYFLEVLKLEQSSDSSSLKNMTPMNRFKGFRNHFSIKPENLSYILPACFAISFAF